jgi:hypothetical protein
METKTMTETNFYAGSLIKEAKPMKWINIQTACYLIGIGTIFGVLILCSEFMFAHKSLFLSLFLFPYLHLSGFMNIQDLVMYKENIHKNVEIKYSANDAFLEYEYSSSGTLSN